MKTRKKTKCPYYQNPRCTLVQNAKCEANPAEPTSCTDYIYRKTWHGEHAQLEAFRRFKHEFFNNLTDEEKSVLKKYANTEPIELMQEIHGMVGALLLRLQALAYEKDISEFAVALGQAKIFAIGVRKTLAFLVKQKDSYVV